MIRAPFPTNSPGCPGLSLRCGERGIADRKISGRGKTDAYRSVDARLLTGSKNILAAP